MHVEPNVRFIIDIINDNLESFNVTDKNNINANEKYTLNMNNETDQLENMTTKVAVKIIMAAEYIPTNVRSEE